MLYKAEARADDLPWLLLYIWITALYIAGLYLQHVEGRVEALLHQNGFGHIEYFHAL